MTEAERSSEGEAEGEAEAAAEGESDGDGEVEEEGEGAGVEVGEANGDGDGDGDGEGEGEEEEGVETTSEVGGSTPQTAAPTTSRNPYGNNFAADTAAIALVRAQGFQLSEYYGREPAQGGGEEDGEEMPIKEEGEGEVPIKMEPGGEEYP